MYIIYLSNYVAFAPPSSSNSCLALWIETLLSHLHTVINERLAEEIMCSDILVEKDNLPKIYALASKQ